jgi:hypothetical protein
MEAASGDSCSWRAYLDPCHVDVPRVAGDLTAANWRYTQLSDGANPAVPQDLYYTGVIPVGGVSQDDASNNADVGNGLNTQYDNSGLIWPARTRVCKNGASGVNALNSAGYTLTFKPFLQLLSMKELLPINLIQGGIQLVLDLAPAVRAMSLHENIALDGTNESLDYNIVRPRFFAQMIQPSEEVVRKYVELYNQGLLNYNIRGVRHFMNVQGGGAGEFSFPLNVNVRSARQVISICQNYKANTATLSGTNDQSSFVYDATGRFLKANLRSYQYTSGSDNFPERKVDLRISNATDDPVMAEAFSQLMKCFGHHASTLYEPRFRSWEWFSLNNDDTTDTNESFKLMMCARLDRGDTKLSGYDLSINPLNVVMEPAGAYATAVGTNDRYIHTYVTYDQVISISSDGIIRRS